METNRLHPGDRVKVTIFNEEGALVTSYESSGFHTVEDAVFSAIRNRLDGDENVKDYVYDVADESTGTEERYRINAHGHVHLIV